MTSAGGLSRIRPTRLWRAGRPETPAHASLPGLQYLRGLAALAVALDHTSGMMGMPKYAGRHPFGGWLEGGGAGVELFFCLSGFIIVYISFDAGFRVRTDIARFARRRFDRIVPYMWLVVVLYAALRVLGRGSFPWPAYLRALTLFPVGQVEPLMIWTLRHEALFYVVFAVGFLAKRPRPAIAALWLAGPFAVFALGPGFGPGAGGWKELVGFLFSPVNLLFAAGAALALAFLRSGQRWPRPPGALILVGVAAICGLERAIGFSHQNMVQVLLVTPLAVFTLAVAVNATEPPWLGPPLKRLGDASYSLYLIHPMVISAMLGVLSHRIHDVSLLTLIIALSCILSGVAAHVWVERPLVSWIAGLRAPAARPAPRAAVATS